MLLPKACVINTKNIPSSRNIGNHWYSNALATGGEGIKHTKNVAQVVYKKGYQIAFLCFGRQSPKRDKEKYLQTLNDLASYGITVFLQQVHNIKNMNFKDVRDIAKKASFFLSPLKAHADLLQENNIENARYFPNAVDLHWLSQHHKVERNKSIDLLVKGLIPGRQPEESIQIIQNIHQAFPKVHIVAVDRIKLGKLKGIKLVKRMPQNDFIKLIADSKLALDMTHNRSFGRFGIECAALQVPLIHSGRKDSNIRLWPTYPESIQAAIDDIKYLLQSPKSRLSRVSQARACLDKFYSLEAWQKRYKELIKVCQ